MFTEVLASLIQLAVAVIKKQIQNTGPLSHLIPKIQYPCLLTNFNCGHANKVTGFKEQGTDSLGVVGFRASLCRKSHKSLHNMREI